MSTLRAVTLCSYLTEVDGIVWRTGDYAANKAVKTLKGKEFNGYYRLRLEGAVRHFEQSNAADFLPYVHRAYARQILAAIPPAGADLVPIPNSHVVAPGTPDFRTKAIAEAVAALHPGRLAVKPCLVFRKPQPKSSEGGSRDPDYLQDQMKVVPTKPTRAVILVDDVFTTGAHFIAAARTLRGLGHDVVMAIAFGRSTKVQHEKAFAVREEQIDLDPVDIDLSDFF